MVFALRAATRDLQALFEPKNPARHGPLPDDNELDDCTDDALNDDELELLDELDDREDELELDDGDEKLELDGDDEELELDDDDELGMASPWKSCSVTVRPNQAVVKPESLIISTLGVLSYHFCGCHRPPAWVPSHIQSFPVDQ